MCTDLLPPLQRLRPNPVPLPPPVFSDDPSSSSVSTLRTRCPRPVSSPTVKPLPLVLPSCRPRFRTPGFSRISERLSRYHPPVGPPTYRKRRVLDGTFPTPPQDECERVEVRERARPVHNRAPQDPGDVCPVVPTRPPGVTPRETLTQGRPPSTPRDSEPPTRHKRRVVRGALRGTLGLLVVSESFVCG